MNPTMILYFVRLLLCNEPFIKWLKEEASKSSTPIDDYAVEAVFTLLCQTK
jgi:hypothetical protein